MPIASETATLGWLLDHTPAETDQALLTSLRSTLGATVAFRTENRFPVGGGWVSVLIAADVDCPLENRQAARVKVTAAMSPAPARMIGQWLQALQSATAGARRSEPGMQLAFDLYSAALSRYPADVAKAVCLSLATTSKWFPVLAEVIEMADKLSARRRMLLEDLSR